MPPDGVPPVEAPPLDVPPVDPPGGGDEDPDEGPPDGVPSVGAPPFDVPPEGDDEDPGEGPPDGVPPDDRGPPDGIPPFGDTPPVSRAGAILASEEADGDGERAGARAPIDREERRSLRFPFEYRYEPGRALLLRARVEPDPSSPGGGFRVAPPGSQDSSFLVSLARANALVVLPADADRVPEGDVRPAFWLGVQAP